VLQWEVHNNLPLCLTQLFMSLAVIVVLMVFKEPLLKNLVYRGHDPNNNSLLRNTNGDINGDEEENVVELSSMPKDGDY